MTFEKSTDRIKQIQKFIGDTSNEGLKKSFEKLAEGDDILDLALFHIQNIHGNCLVSNTRQSIIFAAINFFLENIPKRLPIDQKVYFGLNFIEAINDFSHYVDDIDVDIEHNIEILGFKSIFHYPDIQYSSKNFNSISDNLECYFFVLGHSYLKEKFNIEMTVLEFIQFAIHRKFLSDNNYIINLSRASFYFENTKATFYISNEAFTGDLFARIMDQCASNIIYREKPESMLSRARALLLFVYSKLQESTFGKFYRMIAALCTVSNSTFFNSEIVRKFNLDLLKLKGAISEIQSLSSEFNNIFNPIGLTPLQIIKGSTNKIFSNLKSKQPISYSDSAGDYKRAKK